MAKYEIIGKYMRNGRSEVVDRTDSRRDAEYLQGEYAMAFGQDWVITVVERKQSCEHMR